MTRQQYTDNTTQEVVTVTIQYRTMSDTVVVTETVAYKELFLYILVAPLDRISLF